MGCDLGRGMSDRSSSETIRPEVSRQSPACGEKVPSQTSDPSIGGSSGSQEKRHKRERSHRRISENVLGKLERFEIFGVDLNCRDLPIVEFSDDVEEQRVWERGKVTKGIVSCPLRPPDVLALEPIAMSPAYLGFCIEPGAIRYLHYRGVGLVFARPRGGQFMQPSIDTLLVCQGLGELLAEGHVFRRVVDIGSGSGFLGKFAAVHAEGSHDELSVTLADIDPAASEYTRSAGFNAPCKGIGGRPVVWHHHVGDAVKLLEDDPSFDLLISNPPYIPTREEVVGDRHSSNCLSSGRDAFWEGTGIVVFLIDFIANGRCSHGGHLVLVITSITLKAPGVREALAAAHDRGVHCRCLVEREVAWKAWYAGPSGLNYLLASEKELANRERIGETDFFVGATKPGRSRLQTVKDGRARELGYHWHVVYVLDFFHS